MSLQFNSTLVTVVQAFNRVGLMSNSPYTMEQLFAALDKLVGRMYDREVAKQLFEQCQSNARQQVILEDFAQVIMEADKILKRKISQTEDQIVQYTNEKRDFEQQVREAQHTQQLNSQGVERDSQLQVVVVGASNIQFPDFQFSFVTVSVDRNEQTSQISQGSDKANPQFNQQFSFTIETGQEEISIALYAQDRQQQKQLVGKASLDIGEMHDQTVHERNVQLINPRGQLLNTFIKFEAQWIYNKVKYFKDMSEKYELAMLQLQSDVVDYKKDLFIVQEPFLDSGVRTSLQQSLRQAPPPQPPISFGNTAQQFQQGQVKSLPKTQEFGNRNAIPQTKAEGLSDELHFGFIAFVIMIILATFQCFARPAYFDLILGMLFLLIVIRDCFDPQYIKIVGGINVLSIVLDIVWITYYKNWWNGTDLTLPAWGEAGVSIVRLCIVFCVFNLILKAGLCYFLFHYYQASQNVTQYLQFEFWQATFTVGQHKQNIFTHQGLLN